MSAGCPPLKALDTKLDREVSIKVLPGELAADTERLARFEREAKLLASLNHPNIASIYGVEESDGVGARFGARATRSHEKPRSDASGPTHEQEGAELGLVPTRILPASRLSSVPGG